MGRSSRLVLVVLVALAAFGCSVEAQEASLGNLERPNVVFVLTDDQDESTLSRMPNLQGLLVDGGTTFENTVNVYPLCCPSRATMLRGQYAHNHRVVGNGPENGGGWPTFRDRGEHFSTMATWMHDSGYRMAYVGKYMNRYDGSGVPDGKLPGYDKQYVTVHGTATALNEGVPESLPKVDEDRTIAQHALEFVRQNVGTSTEASASAGAGGQPFFLSVGFFAPHSPATYEEKYAGMFPNARVPRDRNYNVAPDADDPPWIKRRAPLSDAQKKAYDAFYRNRLRSLQTVDAFLGNLYDALGPEAENTYVMFYTDNGQHIGDHRLSPGKLTAYEEDTTFPLIVRGPSVPQGVTEKRLVGNHDFAPTIAEIGGATAPQFVDGRSILPLIKGEDVPSWRTAVLSERIRVGDQTSNGGRTIPGWQMVRRQQSAYIHTNDDPNTKARDPATEYYQLWRDPYELNNRADTMPRRLKDSLGRRLRLLANCAGDTCRAAE